MNYLQDYRRIFPEMWYNIILFILILVFHPVNGQAQDILHPDSYYSIVKEAIRVYYWQNSYYSEQYKGDITVEGHTYLGMEQRYADGTVDTFLMRYDENGLIALDSSGRFEYLR